MIRGSTTRRCPSTCGHWRSTNRRSGQPIPTWQPVSTIWRICTGIWARYEEALPLHQRALALWEQVLGPTHPDVAWSLNNLAIIYRVQGRFAEALPLYQRALALREQGLGLAHPDVAMSLNNLADLHRAQGHYAEPCRSSAGARDPGAGIWTSSIPKWRGA